MKIELYRFVIGAKVYAHTTAQQPVTYQSTEYAPMYIKRDSVKSTEQLARAGISVTVPRDADVAGRFIGGAPAAVCELDIFQQDNSNTIVIWSGRVLSANWQGSEAVLKCEPIQTSLKRSGLHARYQKMCRHALYDDQCGIDKNNFRVAATLTARTDLTLTATEFDAKPDGWFTAGYIELGDHRRAIVGHSGDTITLASPLVDSEAGDSVAAFAGCAHNTDACINKFGNIVNYGGQPFTPRQNPFGSNPVF